MKNRPNVALIVETSVVYGREILRGIARYERTYGDWSVFLDERELGAPPPQWLANWDGHGVICRPTTPALAQTFRERGLAVVDLNDRYGYLGFPRLGSDMAAIGRLATEHLLERGFEQIAFCGFSDEAWSQQRLHGAQAAAQNRAEICGVFESSFSGLREYAWQEERDRIGAWLQTLPQPLGVVACNDVRGHHVLDACRVLGIAVPEAIAVVGVDNAETFCELCDPPLSSVVPDAERIGFEAAALLARLMNGKAATERETLVEPREIITRQSSDVFAIADPAIASALRFIREHGCEKISVDEVAAQVRLSRSTLERGFRRFLHRSPQEEIRRVRLKRVQQLLLETDWTLERIAQNAGFEHTEYMMVQFKRMTGQTPSQWRQRYTRTKSL